MTDKPFIPGDLGNVEASGIVRYIDDIGRVVIPREIRRALGIVPLGRLEIFFSENSGLIIMRKYGDVGTACIGCGDIFGGTTKVVAMMDRGSICASCVETIDRGDNNRG